jgi:hypothetical protein
MNSSTCKIPKNSKFLIKSLCLHEINLVQEVASFAPHAFEKDFQNYLFIPDHSLYDTLIFSPPIDILILLPIFVSPQLLVHRCFTPEHVLFCNLFQPWFFNNTQ